MITGFSGGKNLNYQKQLSQGFYGAVAFQLIEHVFKEEHGASSL